MVPLIQGTTLTVAEVDSKLISRNERVEVDARRAYYEKAAKAKKSEKNRKSIERGQYLGNCEMVTMFVLSFFRENSSPNLHNHLLMHLLGLWAESLLRLLLTTVTDTYLQVYNVGI